MNSHPQSGTRSEFLQRHRSETEKGLTGIDFFVGDVSQATVDDFLQESRAIDLAIEEKRCSPLSAEI